MAFNYLSDPPRTPVGKRFQKTARFEANGDTTGTVDLHGITDADLVQVSADDSAHGYQITSVGSSGLGLSGLNAAGTYNVLALGLGPNL